MKVGTRIIYEEDSKKIVSILHRMEGNVIERNNESLFHKDILYDDFDPATQYIAGIDDNGTPIIEKLPASETEEQKRIRELEDALLLQMENEIGGIL